MSNTSISFEDSNLFSKIILDYVNNQAEIAPFYNLRPEIASYKTMMEQKNYNNNFRPILVDALNAQYHQASINLTKTPAVANNINALLANNTFTVTTGHQLCLYTGPLYFIYKIISTIKWCEELTTAYPDKNFVPLFWMASEDHDYEEINHIYINAQKHTWNIDSKQQPVGRLSLGGFDLFAQEIISLANNSFAKKQLEEWSACYTSSPTLSIATRKLVNLLFADKGLVILDADNKELKQLLVPYIKKDIIEQSNFKALSETNKLLPKKYKTQINGRDINYFYLSNEGRKLIKKINDRFMVDGTEISFSESELITDIENNPENYSPNVVLRPLYQEIILPNLSYIGGPGEIAYWLQLKSVFENNHISFPILTLRSFVLLLNEQHKNQLSKIGLSVNDFFKHDVDVERKLVALNLDGGQVEIIQNIAQNLQQLINIALKTDNKIASDIIKNKSSWENVLQKINSNLDKKQREKVANHSEKFKQIKSNYFINNTIQERVTNILSYGVTESLSTLIESMSVLINISQNQVQVVIKQG